MYSFAGGTTDSSVIEDIVGLNLSSPLLGDDTITDALGERGLRLKNNVSNNPTPRANGVSSYTYGTGNNSITAMSNTYGIGSEAGSKGFYIHKITIPDGTTEETDIVINLSTVQKPWYQHQGLFGLRWETVNPTSTWNE